MGYFILTYINKSIGKSGENCGTNYDLPPACAVCGTFAQVTGNLKVKFPKIISKDLFQTIDGDYIISEMLYQQAEFKNINMEGLKKTMDDNGDILPYYHLRGIKSLPQAKLTKGLLIENQCSTCKRNGYFNELIMGKIENGRPTVVKPVKLTYNDQVFIDMQDYDILNTWEHMGLSNLVNNGNMKIRYARPLLVVSQKLKNFLEQYGLQDLIFEPLLSCKS